MKVIIIGAGLTGVQLARALIAEGSDVVLMDNDPERVRHSRNKLDCAVVQTDGNSLKALENAGIASARSLVALTEDDEVNMVVCALAASAYPKVLKIARVRNDDYYAGAIMGVDRMVHPDVEAAAAICRAMSHGAVGNVVPIGGDFGIASIPVEEGSAMAGVPLWTLASLPEWRYLVAYVESGAEAFLPSGDTVLSPRGRPSRLHVVSPYSARDASARSSSRSFSRDASLHFSARSSAGRT